MTLEFKNAYITNSHTLISRNEHKIKIKADTTLTDYYDSEKSVEQAEAKFQIKSIENLIKKEKLTYKDINMLIGGDLQSQLFASSFAARKFDIPFLGIYSACATFVEGLIQSASFMSNLTNRIILTTSAHNLASEKQFRFPIEYGALRKKVNTFTATGSVSTLVTNTPSNIKIEYGTIGKVIDLGYNDANNFGACMAPSAAKTISEHLKDTNRTIDYYDIVLTGDLGIYGVKILKDYLKKEYKIEANNIVDAGYILFEDSELEIIAGGSGPICLPLILFGKILKENYKKILLVGTGSLHSKTSCNLGESIPSISHAVSLEVIK